MYVPPLGIVHILFIKLFHHISYTMLFEMEDQLKGILLDLLNLLDFNLDKDPGGSMS
jgi:hypothetical protein